MPDRAERSWLRRVRSALGVLAVSAVVACAGLLGIDIYLHHRVQNVAGVNIWGYRGPVVGKKQPGETRIVVIGGSTAFGYGLPAHEAWPYYLEQKINARRPATPVRVVNLGVPADSARTFVATLQDYAYLNFDIACFYEGYNDLGTDERQFRNLTNPDVAHYLEWRHQSPIFRWTGYFPIFPLVLSEKAMAMRHGGNLNAAYGTEKVVFRPNLATRTTAAAMKTASEIGVQIERKFGQLSNTRPVLSEATDETCGTWRQYCGAVADAVHHTIAQGKRAIVISQPYLSDLHVDQQTALAAMLAHRFGRDPRVRYVNLGRVIDMQDKSLVYDGIHLVARGNDMIAGALTPEILEMLK